MMRNTSDSRAVTRHVGHVERRDAKTGLRSNQCSRSIAHPGKQLRIAVASLDPGIRFVLPSSAEPLLKISRVGRWWPNASDQSVPSGRFKTHYANQIPGCLCCFNETRSLCSRHLARAETRPQSLGAEHAISPTCPISGLPHAHGCANQDLPKRERKCGGFSKLPPCICPNLQQRKADHSQLVTRSGRSTMEKQQQAD